MITNFHLARSTLIALVAAMTGLEQQRHIYAQAIALQKRDKPGQALKAFLKVAARAPDQPFGNEALEKAAAIEKKRDEQFAATQALVDAGNGREAVPLLEKFLRDYEDPSGAARDLLKKARR